MTLPSLNESQEIKFGDNDTLSAVTSSMIHADFLVLLTDVDGLYTANPRKDPTAKQVEVVESVAAIRSQGLHCPSAHSRPCCDVFCYYLSHRSSYTTRFNTSPSLHKHPRLQPRHRRHGDQAHRRRHRNSSWRHHHHHLLQKSDEHRRHHQLPPRLQTLGALGDRYASRVPQSR